MLNKRFFRRLYSISILLCLCGAGQALAFEHRCASLYQPCLDNINTQLLHATSARQRAGLLLEKGILKAIYGYYPDSRELLEPLIDSMDLNEIQAISAAIYLAKIYFLLDMPEKSKDLALKAEYRVGKVASQTLDWRLLVEYSNILTYNGKLRESWEVLSELLVRPHAGVSHQVLADMYGNLGHLAIKLNRNQLHLEYRRKSFQHALKVNNPQQWGIAAHNLARAYAGNLDFDDAHRMYNKSIGFSLQAGDISTANYSRFRMAEMNFTMGLYPVARKILIALLASDLSNSPLVPPERARGLLNKVHDRMFTAY